MQWAEDYDHFAATFGPPRPPAWLADMSKFVHPNAEARRGVRHMSHRLAPRKQCMSPACLEALQLAEVFPAEYKAQTVRYSQCKCTSSDYLNLSAEKCELDTNGQPTETCIPCEIGTSTSNVCGTWTYTYSDCDTTCGFGKQSRTDCFTFFAADKNAENAADQVFFLSLALFRLSNVSIIFPSALKMLRHVIVKSHVHGTLVFVSHPILYWFLLLSKLGKMTPLSVKHVLPMRLSKHVVSMPNPFLANVLSNVGLMERELLQDASFIMLITAVMKFASTP